MSAARERILVVGDAVAHTGFARLLGSLLARLHARFEIHQLGINFDGDPHPHPWPIYPAKNGGDAYGVGRLSPLALRLRPRAVLLVGDPWTLAAWMDELRKLDGGAADAGPAGGSMAPILYVPVDSGSLDPAFVRRFAGARRIVAYTGFGRRTIEAAIAEARRQDADRELDLPAIDVIPHGVDTGEFFPYPEDPGAGVLRSGRALAKRSLFPELPSPESSFVVLNANRNQPRKRIDVTLQGFARFARDKPASVRLYLHMGTEDAGWNLLRVSEQLGIQRRLILSSLAAGVPDATVEQMNLIYNACDVGLNTATGEGWGLVAFEHGAAGGAQVMTAHPVARELWAGAAELVEPIATLINPGISTEAFLAGPADVAAALERLYRDRQHLAAMQAAALANARRPELGWDAIAASWIRLIEQTIGATGTAGAAATARHPAGAREPFQAR